MSRSSPTLTNPAHRFFEYKAGTGEVQYWDKEKAERVTIPFPFEFLVLDELSTITGFSRKDNASYYSNEVRNSRKEEFTLKMKGATVVTTLYKNEHDVVQVPKAAKYTKSIYLVFKQDGKFVIGNIKLAGSAMTAWIEFSQKHKVQNGKVIMTKGEVIKGEQSDYYPPAFEYVNATPEEDKEAIALDKVLQVYLGQYLTAKPDDDEVSHDAIDPELGKATPAEIADFEKRKAQKLSSANPLGQLKADDFPDEDTQAVYNRQAVDEVFFDEPLPDLPPELRG